MKLPSTLDLSGAIESFAIQPTPSFYESKSSTPTTEQLSVCDIFNCLNICTHCSGRGKILLSFTVILNCVQLHFNAVLL